jgi:hypothetical protein
MTKTGLKPVEVNNFHIRFYVKALMITKGIKKGESIEIIPSPKCRKYHLLIEAFRLKV